MQVQKLQQERFCSGFTVAMNKNNCKNQGMLKSSLTHEPTSMTKHKQEEPTYKVIIKSMFSMNEDIRPYMT